MLLTKEAVTVYEGQTGVKYEHKTKSSTKLIPKRFYCHWLLPVDTIQYDENNKEIVDDYKDGQCCFNHRVGLPSRKWESDIGKTEVIPVELNHFNRRMMFNYFLHRKYSKNKCRGDGTTEMLTVRWNVFKYGVLDNVKNRKGIIMPGTSSKLTIEISTRIKALCEKIPEIFMFGVPDAIAPLKFHFKTGGRLELTSATPDADRGYENVGDINEEEVAHWELINDKPVYYAGEGVHNKTRCHITHNTTPRGKRGFYYELIWAPEATSGFYKHIVNWREVVGLPVVKIEDLYNIGHIDEIKLNKMRKELIYKYHHDGDYHNWYDTFKKSGVGVFWDNDKLISIEEICDIPITLLDINTIVSGAKEDKSHYDQELDNEFLSGENRAIGEFMEENIPPVDMASILQQYKSQVLQS